MTIRSMLAQNEDQGSLTVFVNGQVLTAENTHPAWWEMVDLVTRATRGEQVDETHLANLFDASKAVATFFNKVSDRVAVQGGHVYLDGDEVSDKLANHIIRFSSENPDRANALVNFLEKIATNPNEHSREQLYAWLERRDFAITPDGDFIAYKGVRPRNNGDGSTFQTVDGEARYPYESISRGEAIVDGQVYKGAIPNGVGAVVEMPRSKVAHDPNVACHTGLHVGNFRYANSFAQGALLTCVVNPRDVVSVPHDSDSEKIRTCRYTVLEVNEQQREYDTSYFEYEDDLDVDYSDEEDDEYMTESDVAF